MLAWMLGGAFVLKRLVLAGIDSKMLLLVQLPRKGGHLLCAVYFVMIRGCVSCTVLRL